MPLPPRFAWTIIEAAARWGCMPADIAGWAVSGRLALSLVLGTVMANGSEVGGVVTVPPEEVVCMFRRDGSGSRTATVRKVKLPEGPAGWQRITDPADGIQIDATDVIITGAELDRFEDEHGLTRRAGGGGSATRHDWDGFYGALIRRIHYDGLPDTQSELVAEMQGWFERRSETGDGPDESTIRKKIGAIWKELRA